MSLELLAWARGRDAAPGGKAPRSSLPHSLPEFSSKNRTKSPPQVWPDTSGSSPAPPRPSSPAPLLPAPQPGPVLSFLEGHSATPAGLWPVSSPCKATCAPGLTSKALSPTRPPTPSRLDQAGPALAPPPPTPPCDQARPFCSLVSVCGLASCPSNAVKAPRSPSRGRGGGGGGVRASIR